jgi:hypothetical protein
MQLLFDLLMPGEIALFFFPSLTHSCRKKKKGVLLKKGFFLPGWERMMIVVR